MHIFQTSNHWSASFLSPSTVWTWCYSVGSSESVPQFGTGAVGQISRLFVFSRSERAEPIVLGWSLQRSDIKKIHTPLSRKKIFIENIYLLKSIPTCTKLLLCWRKGTYILPSCEYFGFGDFSRRNPGQFWSFPKSYNYLLTYLPIYLFAYLIIVTTTPLFKVYEDKNTITTLRRIRKNIIKRKSSFHHSQDTRSKLNQVTSSNLHRVFGADPKIQLKYCRIRVLKEAWL